MWSKNWYTISQLSTVIAQCWAAIPCIDINKVIISFEHNIHCIEGFRLKVFIWMIWDNCWPVMKWIPEALIEWLCVGYSIPSATFPNLLYINRKVSQKLLNGFTVMLFCFISTLFVPSSNEFIIISKRFGLGQMQFDQNRWKQAVSSPYCDNVVQL